MKITEKAQRIHDLYEKGVNSQSREKWRTSSESSYAFYLGNQLTKEEFDALVDKKMPTFIINKMTPQIELMMYFLTARHPRWQAVGVDESDSTQAEIHAKVAQYVWYTSKGQTVFQQIVRDCLTKSIGYIKIGIDPDLDDGFGEVIVDFEDSWNVIVDPHSKDPFFNDASYILIAKDMTIERAVIEFPELSRREILKMTNNNRDYLIKNWESPVPFHSFDVPDQTDSLGESNEHVKHFEFYTQKKVPYIKVIMEIEGNIEYYSVTKKEWDIIVKKEENLEPDKKVFTGKNLVDTIQYNKRKFYKTECLGFRVIDEDIELPCSNYPIIPLCYRHTGTPYPMSVAMDMKGKQEEINKSHQIMIHHANLSSTPRYMAEDGQITNIKEWEKSSSTPGAVLTYAPSMEGKPPTAVQPMALNSAFYQIARDGVHDLEYISGMSSYAMGQGDMSGRETYRGMLAQDDFGTRRVRGFATNVLNEFMSIVGKTIDDFAKFLYRTEKVIMISNPDDPELIERHVVNPIGEEDVNKFFDENSGKYNIMFVGGSTLLVNRWAELEEMLNLYEKGIVDKTSVLMKTDVSNKKNIMNKMDELQQAMGQVQSLQEEVEKLAKNNEILERQLVNARISSKVAEANIDVNAEKERFISRLQDILQTAKGSVEEKKREIQKLIDELERETDKKSKE